MGIHDLSESAPFYALASEPTLIRVTLILYSLSGVLHRDISPSDVLMGDKSMIFTKLLCQGLGDMCFSNYLLEEYTEQDDSDLEHALRIGDAYVD